VSIDSLPLVYEELTTTAQSWPFSGLADTMDRHAVGRETDALLLLELVHDVSHESDVEVLAAEMRVTVGRLDSKTPFWISRIEISKVPRQDRRRQ
jgi:hypothetical protein